MSDSVYQSCLLNHSYTSLPHSLPWILLGSRQTVPHRSRPRTECLVSQARYVGTHRCRKREEFKKKCDYWCGMVHEQGFLKEVINTSQKITGLNKNSDIFLARTRMYSCIQKLLQESNRSQYIILLKTTWNTRSHNDYLFTLVLKLLVILRGSLGGNQVKINPLAPELFFF